MRELTVVWCAPLLLWFIGSMENVVDTADVCGETLATLVSAMINIPALSLALRLMVTFVAILVYGIQGMMVYKLYSNGLVFDPDLISSFIRNGYLDVQNANITSSCGGVACSKNQLASLFATTHEELQAQHADLDYREISAHTQLCLTSAGLENGFTNLTMVLTVSILA